MRETLLIIAAICATPIILAKVIDIHIPVKEDFYFEQMQEKNKEVREANDILKDQNSTEEDRARACETLVQHGVMA